MLHVCKLFLKEGTRILIALRSTYVHLFMEDRCHQVSNLGNKLYSLTVRQDHIIKLFGRMYSHLTAASDWPHSFFTPKVFLFSIIFIYTYILLISRNSFAS